MSIFSKGGKPNKESGQVVTQRIMELDGLRGMAIILVISFHYINNQLVHASGVFAKSLFKITSFGWVGVDLFFILSGFLIGQILIKEKKSVNYFSTFYIRRIVRIIPNYYFLLIVFLLLLFIPALSNNYFLTGNNVVPVWSYFLMLQNFYMGHLNNMGNSALSVTWSIGIEEQFYIIMPLIVYFLKDKWLPFFLILLIILAPVLRFTYSSWIPTYVLPFNRMDSLSFGVAIAWINYHNDLKSIVQKRYLTLMIVMIVNLLFCLFLFLKFNDLGPIKHTLFGIFFSLSLVFALTLNQSLYCNLLRNNVLRFIGTISYSLYLFHYLILGLFHHTFSEKGGIGIYTLSDILISVFALIFSFFLSWVIYMALETPMVNIGKKFKYQ